MAEIFQEGTPQPRPHRLIRYGGLRSNEAWSSALKAALIATRRDNLVHGTNAAYVAAAAYGQGNDHTTGKAEVSGRKLRC
jgi:hypothetical protein